MVKTGKNRVTEGRISVDEVWRSLNTGERKSDRKRRRELKVSSFRRRKSRVDWRLG